MRARALLSIAEQGGEQMRLKCNGSGLNRSSRAQVPQLRHFKIRIAARMDALKGRKIHIDVESKPVIRGTAADPDTQTCKLRARDVHTWCIAAAFGLNAPLAHSL